MIHPILSVLIFAAANLYFNQLGKPVYISRFLSLILISFISFFLSFFLSFHLAFAVAFLIVVSAIALRIYSGGFIIEWKNDAVFYSTYFFFLFLRSLVPEAIGAEKLMDFAFLSSTFYAERFPPLDPFFAGGKLDFYYYFGYVVAAVVTKIALTTPDYGFNIAMASIPAYTLSILFGFFREFDVNKRILALVPLISGNPHSVYEFFRNILNGKLPGFLYYWNSTRIIPDETYRFVITEFPYFSFIHADLHAHVIAIPVKILFLAILYYIYKEGRFAFLLPILLFVSYATNSWDFPAFLLLSLLVVLKRRGISYLYFTLGLLIVAAYASTMNVKAGFFFTAERSNFKEFLMFWGFILLLTYVYFREEIEKAPHFLIALILAIVSPIFLLIPLAIYSLMRRDFVSYLVLVATLFIASCEFFAIDTRMNTYFKFYILSWVLLSVPAGISLVRIYEKKKALALALVALMLIYPVVATPVRHYKAELTLDATKFLRDYSRGDYEAAMWLRGKEGSVIIEAAGDCYTLGGRIAAVSGKQTVVAWQCHEVQWRKNGLELAERIEDVRKVYEYGNCSLAKSIAEKYNASYIVVGKFEREMYRLRENFSCFELVFSFEGTKVYAKR